MRFGFVQALPPELKRYEALMATSRSKFKGISLVDSNFQRPNSDFIVSLFDARSRVRRLQFGADSGRLIKWDGVTRLILKMGL